VPDDYINHKATAEQLRTEVGYALAREDELRGEHTRAVEYRVRMQINLDLAVERELAETVQAAR
jgi:hypothetical protein